MAFDYDFESEGEGEGEGEFRRRGGGHRGGGRMRGRPGVRRPGGARPGARGSGGRRPRTLAGPRGGGGGGGARVGGAPWRGGTVRNWGHGRSSGSSAMAASGGSTQTWAPGGAWRGRRTGPRRGWRPEPPDEGGDAGATPWIFRWRWPGLPPWWPMPGVVAPPAADASADGGAAQDAAAAPPDGAPPAPDASPAPDSAPSPGGDTAAASAAPAPEASPDDAAPAPDAAPAGELAPWVSSAIASEVERTITPRAVLAWLPPVTVAGHPFTGPPGGGIYIVVRDGAPLYVGETSSFARRWSGRLLSAHQLGLTAPDGRLPAPLSVYFGRLPPAQAASTPLRKAVEHAVVRTLVRGRVVPHARALRNRSSFLPFQVKGALGVDHVLPPDLMARVRGRVPGLTGDRLDLADAARYEVGPA